MIRLGLLRIGKGLSFYPTIHEKMAALRIGRRFNFIPDTKNFWNLVVNYPCGEICKKSCEQIKKDNDFAAQAKDVNDFATQPKNDDDF